MKEKDSLSTKEKRILKNIGKDFKKLKKDFNKIEMYEYKITHDIRNLFNKISKKDYYQPIEVKSALDGNYIQYKSRGDSDDNLSVEEYINIIRPYLRDVINNHKAQ